MIRGCNVQFKSFISINRWFGYHLVSCMSESFVAEIKYKLLMITEMDCSDCALSLLLLFFLIHVSFNSLFFKGNGSSSFQMFRLDEIVYVSTIHFNSSMEEFYKKGQLFITEMDDGRSIQDLSRPVQTIGPKRIRPTIKKNN